jgi:hypothetical protein
MEKILDPTGTWTPTPRSSSLYTNYAILIQEDDSFIYLFIVCLFVCLFVCFSINAASSSDYVESNGRISEYRIGKDVEKGCRGISWGSFPALNVMDWGKPRYLSNSCRSLEIKPGISRVPSGSTSHLIRTFGHWILMLSQQEWQNVAEWRGKLFLNHVLPVSRHCLGTQLEKN